MADQGNQLNNIMTTAQNLLTLLSRVRQGEGQSQPPVQGQRQAVPRPSVQQEMARSFPGLFRKEVRGKKRFTPYARPQKSFTVKFFLMDEQHCKTPTGEEELQLMLAGLGKRSLALTESTTHTELTDLLLEAYPKLGTISGGWMLHKSTGGGGQRKLVVIPPDSEGYTGQQIKSVTGNGKYTLFIAPLQEQIDRTPLPPDAREFHNMPKSPCANCGVMIPLQALPSHIESCKDSIDLCSSSEESYEHDLSPEKTAECPVCRKDFNINVIEAHASGCGLRSAAHEGNRKTSALSLNSFQSLEEILEWVTLQVDDGGTFSIVVSRDDLYTRAMMQWQRQKRSSPKHRLLFWRRWH
ncbi:uncharacterized protein LOC121723270 isoform X2 [Alosa sapidissima]|uniref:uncharacterized protein LOC121723270 isoform X2 n=1 Tax=Alosa sapidissima TaxID=34773 RepID=UPI001C088CBA|nr:uncharacterized protein LOC121723270 isoform X2 [Alosa sapidissima]